MNILRSRGISIRKITTSFDEVFDRIVKILDSIKLSVPEYSNFHKLKDSTVFFLFNKAMKDFISIFPGYCVKFPAIDSIIDGAIPNCPILFLDLSNVVVSKEPTKVSSVDDQINFGRATRQKLRDQKKLVSDLNPSWIFLHGTIDDYLSYEFQDRIINLNRNMFENTLKAMRGVCNDEISDSIKLTIVESLKWSIDGSTAILKVETEMCNTIIIEGTTRTRMNEMKKTVIGKINDELYLIGGGCCEMHIANVLEKSDDIFSQSIAKGIRNAIPMNLIRNSTSENPFEILEKWKEMKSQNIDQSFDCVFIDPSKTRVLDGFHSKIAVFHGVFDLCKKLSKIDNIMKSEDLTLANEVYIDLDEEDQQTKPRQYQRFVPSIEKGISREAKEKLKRKEDIFYQKPHNEDEKLE